MKTRLIIVINLIIIIIFSLIITTILLNHQKEVETWDKAISVNSISSINNYVKKYPEGIFLKSANFKLDELTWNDAQLSNTEESYENYKRFFPSGEFVTKADDLLEELFWDNTLKIQNLKSFVNYISHYPHGKYIEKSQAYIDKHLIKNDKIGQFTRSILILEQFRNKGYSVKQEINPPSGIGGDDEGKIYFNIFKNEDLCFKIFPVANSSDIEIEIFTEEYCTDKYIGVNSTIEQFALAYPDCKIVYEFWETEGEFLCVVINSIKGLFLLDKNDYVGNSDKIEANGDGFTSILNVSDFKKGSKVKSIYLVPENCESFKNGSL